MARDGPASPDHGITVPAHRARHERNSEVVAEFARSVARLRRRWTARGGGLGGGRAARPQGEATLETVQVAMSTATRPRVHAPAGTLPEIDA